MLDLGKQQTYKPEQDHQHTHLPGRQEPWMRIFFIQFLKHLIDRESK